MAPIGPVPHVAGYMNADSSYVQPFQGDSSYIDGYGRPLMQMGLRSAEGMIHYGSGANIQTATAVTGSQAVPVPVWRAPYDPSLAHR